MVAKQNSTDARSEFLQADLPEFTGATTAPDSPLTLWYRQPAGEWNEALPVGNGSLGAMVFGGVNREVLQLNEESLWTGEPIERDQPNALEALQESRKLLFAGKYAEAEALLEEKFMGRRIEVGLHTYQSLGDLVLEFPSSGAVADYRRELDLGRALCTTRFRVGDATFTRTVFSSAPAQLLVVRLECDQPGKISFSATIDRDEDSQIEVEGTQLRRFGRARAAAGTKGLEDAPSALSGVEYEACLKIDAEGGTVVAGEGKLQVAGADSAMLILSGATDYRSARPPRETNQERLAAAGSYAELLERHLADYRRLFDRVSLDLGEDASADLPTDERLRAVAAGTTDLALMSLYFQYGRYLLISSSRPGTLAANLQGIWADGYTPPWNADYHININIQMNYWPAELCNLSECHDPFFELVEALQPRGGKVAREVFGCGGFTAGHTTDVWWHGSLVGRAMYGMWPMGAAWCARHFWERYTFDGDRDFLADKAYPILRGAAEFLVDWLVEHPETGELVSGPSISPENSFLTPEGKRASVVMGPTMDHQIIADVFDACCEASELLDTDADFRQRLRAARAKLAPMRLGNDGRLLEWTDNFEEAEPGHRHISHLYGLYPANLISVDGTPELAEAARAVLDYRLSHGGGHTGWSRAWIVNFFARLHDGERAWENLQALLAKSTLPNLFDNHPPFQIDGNFGGCAAMGEMLVQSQTRDEQGGWEVRLLPALPTAWKQGEVRGLRARGGLEVLQLSWEDGKLAAATLRASFATKFLLRCGETSRQMELAAGETCRIMGADLGIC